jgi:acetylornithine deacetylase/succinyl-diaminopimelate desuccinylase-like protein
VTLYRAISAALLTAASAASFATDYDAEIRSVAESENVRAAMASMEAMGPELETMLIELTEIPAPPFMEEARGRRYAEILESVLPGSVSTDAEGNVIGRIEGAGDGDTVAIVAHLDTVFPPGTDVTVRREGDKLCAPGIGDNSRGLVLMYALAHALTGHGTRPKGDVLLIASVGEEGVGDLRGMRHLFREGGPRIDQFIAIDGGSESRVLNQAVGSIRYKLTFRGPGGHSWGAFGAANPAHALARAIHLFDEAAASFVGEQGAKTTYNIGRIGGGTSVNSIPFENWAEIDMRSEDPVRLDGIDAILKKRVQRALEEQNQLVTRGDKLTVEMKRIGFRPAGNVSVDEPLLQRVLAATRYLGSEPSLIAGSTDANIPISMGIPAVTIGRGGRGEAAHSLRECWTDDNSHIAIQKALIVTLATAGMVTE